MYSICFAVGGLRFGLALAAAHEEDEEQAHAEHQRVRRNAEGNAFAIGQGYWVATNSEQFKEFSTVDSSMTDPAYTKEILDQYAGEGVSYDDFAKFVSQCSFDDIVALKK